MYQSGQIINSPGCTFTYKIIGAVCQLYDRNNLPYPCCNIQYKGKQPSWNRQGKQFISDVTTRYQSVYVVELIGYVNREIIYFTDPGKLSDSDRSWWYSLTKKDQKLVNFHSNN